MMSVHEHGTLLRGVSMRWDFGAAGRRCIVPV